ncbi:MAG: hypothetical protein COB08_005140 [Rhodobacteraceae bacterium]|nr:hypothetical protein [Paracoccaceae bacterium]
MIKIAEKADPIARILETIKNGVTREVGIQYLWDNGELTKLFTVDKKGIVGPLTMLKISPADIVGNNLA